MKARDLDCARARERERERGLERKITSRDDGRESLWNWSRLCVGVCRMRVCVCACVCVKSCMHAPVLRRYVRKMRGNRKRKRDVWKRKKQIFENSSLVKDKKEKKIEFHRREEEREGDREREGTREDRERGETRDFPFKFVRGSRSIRLTPVRREREVSLPSKNRKTK